MKHNTQKMSVRQQIAAMKRVLGYMVRHYRFSFAVVLVCILGSALCSLYGMLFSQRLIDEFIGPLSQAANPDFLPLAAELLLLAAIYAVGIYSLSAWLITDVLPVDVSMASPLAGTDLLLCAVFGGLISGVGSGLTIRYGGAMDGIDVMAVIFAKRLGLSVGTFVMVYNVLLYIVCGFVLHSWILPLYSIVTYAAALKTIDFVVEGVDRSKAATIITARPDEICAALSDRFGSGVTRVAAQGGFSNTELAMIYFVVNRFQIMQVREIVHRLDPAAYISITEVADVFKRDL